MYDSRNGNGALAAAIKVAGGVRVIAAQTGLDPGNLSRFLRGGGGVAAARIALLWTTLGRPDGQADPARVLTLRAGTAEELARALSWHLPDGGQLARIAWTDITRHRVTAAFGRHPLPEVYAATDRSARLVGLLPAGVMLTRDSFAALCPNLKWWHDDPDAAILDLIDPRAWVAGTVDPPEFSAAWPGSGYTPTADDLIAEVRHLRIGYAEAIRRLHRASR